MPERVVLMGLQTFLREGPTWWVCTQELTDLGTRQPHRLRDGELRQTAMPNAMTSCRPHSVPMSESGQGPGGRWSSKLGASKSSKPTEHGPQALLQTRAPRVHSRLCRTAVEAEQAQVTT